MFAVNGTTVSDETISDLVVSLPPLGRGSCRQVFDLGDSVLKVNLGEASTLHGSCETEADHWEALQGTENEHLFAPVLASGDGWLIMVKADSVCDGSDDFHDVMRSAMQLGISDLFSSNMGMFDGVAKVIDYATGHLGYGCSDTWQCECGNHGCEHCYPEGCQCCCSLHHGSEGCEEYEGCRVEACDTCYADAVYHWQESFGFARGVMETNAAGHGVVNEWQHLHACIDHAPSHLVPVQRGQIFGQRGMVIRFSEGVMLLPWEG